MGTLLANLCAFIITFGCILLRMRNVPDKSCRANESTFYIQKLFNENHAVYEMWKK
jgi:hypothetical protein